MSERPGRVRGHELFAALGRSSRRATNGPVRVHFLASGECGGDVLVAYSISRRVGSAVVRNRWRRRLRAVAAEVSPRLIPGVYLVALAPEVNALTFQELRGRVVEAMGAAGGSR